MQPKLVCLKATQVAGRYDSSQELWTHDPVVLIRPPTKVVISAGRRVLIRSGDDLSAHLKA